MRHDAPRVLAAALLHSCDRRDPLLFFLFLFQTSLAPHFKFEEEKKASLKPEAATVLRFYAISVHASSWQPAARRFGGSVLHGSGINPFNWRSSSVCAEQRGLVNFFFPLLFYTDPKRR